MNVMNEPRIAFVCPTFGHFDYAIEAIRSFLRNTPNPLAIIVDDASADWDFPIWQEFLRQKELIHCHFAEQGGINRSWNWGIGRALDEGADYIIAGNSDVVFSENWHRGLIDAIEAGYALVGPVSNAPGPTSKEIADIATYIPDFKPSDDPLEIRAVAEILQARFAGVAQETFINGFFQMAAAEAWSSGRYDENHFYKPRNDFLPDGTPNPYPLMTFSEDELQYRWAAMGRIFGVALSSYIFHYRSVSRGLEFVHGAWMRKGASPSLAD
jgi:glycosyltransferase involved in cell wall biosynthesis